MAVSGMPPLESTTTRRTGRDSLKSWRKLSPSIQNDFFLTHCWDMLVSDWAATVTPKSILLAERSSRRALQIPNPLERMRLHDWTVHFRTAVGDAMDFVFSGDADMPLV